MDNMNLQNKILKECIEDQVSVTLFLMNGFQLRGTVIDFDNLVVVLFSGGKHQMIYKHAISTLTPTKPLESTTCQNFKFF